MARYCSRKLLTLSLILKLEALMALSAWSRSSSGTSLAWVFAAFLVRTSYLTLVIAGRKLLEGQWIRGRALAPALLEQGSDQSVLCRVQLC